MKMYFKHNAHITYDPVADRMDLDLDHMNMTQLLSTRQMLENMMEKRFKLPEAREGLSKAIAQVNKMMKKRLIES